MAKVIDIRFYRPNKSRSKVSCAKRHLLQAALALGDGDPEHERVVWMIEDLCTLLNLESAANQDWAKQPSANESLAKQAIFREP